MEINWKWKWFLKQKTRPPQQSEKGDSQWSGTFAFAFDLLVGPRGGGTSKKNETHQVYLDRRTGEGRWQQLSGWTLRELCLSIRWWRGVWIWQAETEGVIQDVGCNEFYFKLVKVTFKINFALRFWKQYQSVLKWNWLQLMVFVLFEIVFFFNFSNSDSNKYFFRYSARPSPISTKMCRNVIQVSPLKK